MAELVRGSVTDRPWGRTFAAFGLRAVTGQLTVVADGKSFEVAFDRGAVVAAASPLASDAAARVALTCQLVSSTQVPELARRQAATPDRDEVDVVAELARLAPDQAVRLRRRVIAQRAARTFSINRGDFVVTDQIALPILVGCELDVRAIIYMGARANLSEQRLSAELAQLGAWFRLRPTAIADLPQFGFTDLEHAVLERLRDGGTLAEIEEAATRFVDARTVRAAVYALASCNACELERAQPVAQRAAPPPLGARAGSSGPPGSDATQPLRPTRSPTAAPPASSAEAPRPEPAAREAVRSSPPATQPPMRSGTMPPPIAAAAAPSRGAPQPAAPSRGPPQPAAPSGGPPQPAAPSRDGSSPGLRRPPDAPDAGGGLVMRRMAGARPAERQVAKTDSPQAHTVKALIAQRLKLLDQGADHFALLGVAQDAGAEDLRKAYFALARQLHPDRLAALGIPDDGKHAQRLFAQINAGFAVLSDPARRAEYLGVLRRGGEAAIREEQAGVEELARRVLEAEEAFRRGDLALRRDQPQVAVAELSRALQLNPDEADYHALLAWAQFCAAPDKAAVGAGTRKLLEQAIQRAPRSVTARFYLGRVERMLGRDQDALRAFREVLEAAPGHAEAAAEVRALEARGERGGGLFSRLKR